MRTGRTGTRACTATSPTPALNGAISPVRLRVPSGKITTRQPSASNPSTARMDSAPRPIRRKGTAANHDTSKRYARRWNQ